MKNIFLILISLFLLPGCFNHKGIDKLTDDVKMHNIQFQLDHQMTFEQAHQHCIDSCHGGRYFMACYQECFDNLVATQ